MPRIPWDTRGRTASVDLARLPGAQAILRKGLWALWVVGTTVAALGAFQGELHAFLAGGVLFVLTPVFLALLAGGRQHAAITATVTTLLLLGCTLVVTGGGIHDVGVVVFPAVSVLSALLLERRLAILFATLVPLTAGAVGFMEMAGLLHTDFSAEVSMLDVLIVMLVLAGIGWLIQTLARTLYERIEHDYYREQTYREIFNASNETIVIHDAHTGEVVDVNERALALTGFPREALLKFSLADFAPGGEHDMDRALQLLRKAREEGPQIFEWRMADASGATKWVEVCLRGAQILGEERVIATVRDIQERKLVEARLLASERLQAVGQLAGGVAHDFNNQLTAIIANASLLRRQLAGDGYAMAKLDAILGCSNRSADLTRQLLAFARKHQSSTESVDMGDLATEVTSLLRHSVDKRIEIELLEETQRGWVIGDPSLLQNALLNLGLNARDAMPSGGKMIFRTRLVNAEGLSDEAAARLGQPSGAYVRTSVEDDGVGMEPEVAQRVFEPFFTTKAGGVGMGLAAVYGTVKSHDGALVVHSERGRGTRIEIYLPATDRAPAEAHGSSDENRLPVLHLMLAEDDEHVARSTQEILESFGCRVSHFEDGVAALQAFERAPQHYDVVLLDHAMPRMTGRDLAVRLRNIRADIPIIATSGYGEDFRGAGEDLQCVFLPKPFDVNALREAVEAAVRPG